MMSNVYTVYGNYDLFTAAAIQEARDSLLKCGYDLEEITDICLYGYINQNDSDNWKNARNDKRAQQYVYSQTAKRYSVLLHFAAKVYGYSVEATA